jgi:peptide/nickel transport system permease protein
MRDFLVRRLATTLPVLLIVSVLSFAGFELVPGGAVQAVIAGEGETSNLTGDQIKELAREHGLDRPLPIRYAKYMERLLHGDMGRSIRTKQPVTSAIGERLSVSIWLSATALILHVSIGLLLGVIAGINAGGKIDLAATMLAVIGVATPGFWLAIVLILVFAVELGWLPASGWVDPWERPWDAVRHMILPVIALGIFGSASVMRQTRSAIVEVMAQDYIRTARSKGIRERSVVVRHGLKNALLPVVTVIAFQIPGLLGGSVLIERVFAIPGVGRLAVDATLGLDYPVILGIVFMAGAAIIVANFLADVAYAVLDPRIRLT